MILSQNKLVIQLVSNVNTQTQSEKEQKLLEKFQDSKYLLNLRKTAYAKLSSPLLFIFTDLCEGELTDLISKKISKKQIISIMVQLLFGLEELKQMKIIHVDIKPQNILYNYQNGNYQIKIADFGQAKQLQDKDFTDYLTRVGTLKYTSKEILSDDEKIGYKSDVYSLGIVFIELIFGRLFDYQQEIKPLKQGNWDILSQRPKVENRIFDKIDDFLIEKIIKNMIQSIQYERKDSRELLSLIFQEFLTNHQQTQVDFEKCLDKLMNQF
ncbi:hypothetical protein ABPG74_000587 [Tetrahymena malaccensis]